VSAAAVATALGPAARIRNPLGADLPPSLELTFCASPESNMPAAVADGFRLFCQTVNGKLRWREAAGSRQLRAEFLEILHGLGQVEKEILRFGAAPAPPPPTLSGN